MTYSCPGCGAPVETPEGHVVAQVALCSVPPWPEGSPRHGKQLGTLSWWLVFPIVVAAGTLAALLQLL